MYDLIMERKIFTSDESRIRNDPSFWWLRSVYYSNYTRGNVGYVHNNGYVYSHYTGYKLGVIVACTI